MQVRYKKKDLQTIRNSNAEVKFLEILKAIKAGEGDLVREQTTESDVYWVTGDYRLLARKSPADPREIILAQHSGRGPQGGSYEQVNGGQPNEVIDIDALMDDFK